MPPRRILLTNLPPLLRDIVGNALGDERGLEVVQATGDCDELEARLAGTPAHLVITGASGPRLPEPCRRLMYQHPRLNVLTLTPDGRRAALWRLLPRRRLLGEVGPDELALAVRRAARAGRGEE